MIMKKIKLKKLLSIQGLGACHPESVVTVKDDVADHIVGKMKAGEFVKKSSKYDKK